MSSGNEHEQSQPEKKNKALNFLKRTGIIPYLRELSIVIIGILITLSITTFINNYNRQKELTGMLRLVKEELIVNLSDFNFVKNRFLGEQYINEQLSRNLKDITKIPADTLEKYSYVMGAIYSFEPKTDSYEVLKNSVLIQYVKEQDLKYKLSGIYKNLYSFSMQLARYSDKKAASLEGIISMMDGDEVDSWLNADDIYYRFSFPVKERSYRNFVVSGGTIFSPGFIQSCEEQLTNLINEMEQYGY